DAAYKRIRAARAAVRFPQVLAGVKDGRLHLSAICLLAEPMTEENVDELIAAATHRRKEQIERWLEMRFAPPLLVASVAAEPPGAMTKPECDPQQGETDLLRREAIDGLPAGPAPDPAAAAEAVAPRSALAPHVILRVALPQATHDKLRRAEQLLSHAVP